jgi:hypothetical protein
MSSFRELKDSTYAKPEHHRPAAAGGPINAPKARTRGNPINAPQPKARRSSRADPVESGRSKKIVY